jgi:hypothetical protein
LADITALPKPQSQIDPQRLAWGVMLLSFAIFCLICLAAGVGVNYFLFQSTVNMETVVQVGQGTLTVSDRSIRQSLELISGDRLSTDPQTQATIFFRDATLENRLIASVTLRGDTDLTVRRTARPRFDWSSVDYTIELQSLSGDLDIFVAKDLTRPLRLTVNTSDGALVDIGSSGQYTVSALPGQVKAVNRQGQLILTPPGSHIGHAIPVENQGTIFAANPTEVVMSSAYVNLLANSTFEEVFESSDGGLAVGWGCANPLVDPPGSYQAEVQDGRTVLRLVRAGGAITPGETRCIAPFPNGGYDIRGLNSLVLRASFAIQYQSLAACGFEGSECPLMLRVDYIDASGDARVWYHGFYYLNQQDYPERCDSCFEEHEQVNEKAWYTYDSGNWLSLFTPLPLDQRPVRILNVQFYASGHQYDVYVGEVALLAGS